MSRPLYFYSQALLGYNMGPQHPMRPERLRMTHALLDAYGLFEHALELAPPELADEEEVEETHSRDFLEALSSLDRGDSLRNPYRYGLGTGDNPIFPGIYEASLRYTGGSLGAAQAVLDGASVAFNMAGGLHHAHYDRAAGFCVLNDCAVGIRRLRRKFSRVAYVDIDVHHGDGVQESFYSDPTVLTVSLQEVGRAFFPGTGYVEEIGEGAGEGYSVNVPFAPYTPGDIWLQGWREAALPILKAFDPEAILLQLGTDTHALDPLAHLALRAQDWLEAVKDVQALGKPIVAVGGGGYNLTTVTRMWALAVGTLAGQELPDDVPDSYAWKHNIPTLTDHVRFEVDAYDRQLADRFAAQSIADVKTLLFPRYGLK
ncbi:MAG TPA: acetoin utilization protein AcuC [Chthonomonadaceae bacterium]|nr:acetoin utilization protein AcuC [Chthonomonadaceae bacterium]